MPLLTQYSNMPDDEFLRELELYLDKIGIAGEMWDEVLRRVGMLLTRPTQEEVDDVTAENDRLQEEISDLENEIHALMEK